MALSYASYVHAGHAHDRGPVRSTRLTFGVAAAPRTSLTSFPALDDRDKLKSPHIDKHDSPFELKFDNDPFESSAMTGAGSPYIKSEPNDFNFDPNQYMQYNANAQHRQAQAFGGNMNINPASLTGGMSQSFSQNGFNLGGSGIADDELEGLQFESSNGQGQNFDFNTGVSNFMPNSIPVNRQQQVGSMYSHTPDGAPMQSPFNNGFNYAHFQGVPNQQFPGAHSLPQQAGYPQSHPRIDRKISGARSPGTPGTAGMHALQIGPNAQQIRHQRQQGSLGNDWDSTPSGHSWNESSPFPSPVNGHPMNRQISEVLTGHGQPKITNSLPTKMEPGTSHPGLHTQEAKRRRRRESHNAVERRRRDNINERIQELGMLVPQHRLEDEKVRKHLQTNAPLSPSISNATGMSPPAATSLLAGPSGRRATTAGNITQGLPMEEKDKGPNKGDILNGSVAWTRDVMWYMHLKLRQEQELKGLVQNLGGVWPYDPNDEEKRMNSEICEVLNKHAPLGGFTGYSRAAGSGLRVPGFTNVAGDSVNADGQVISNGNSHGQQSISPGFQSGGSGMSSGGMSHNQSHFGGGWDGDFKEEDEYATMDS
nr:hypothetical protein B0A51_05791 [Rachicladosporium sp. CCFEE 5018]